MSWRATRRLNRLPRSERAWILSLTDDELVDLARDLTAVDKAARRYRRRVQQELTDLFTDPPPARRRAV